MSYRYMRVIVFFDLPSVTNADKKEYRTFRNFLQKSGYIMLQESVYCKLALNLSVVDSLIANIRKNKPISGLVQIITLTERQYSKMENLVGETSDIDIESTDRIIVL